MRRRRAPAGAPAASGDDEFKPSAAIVEVLVNFLIRVALIAGETKDAQGAAGAAGLSEHCVALLDQGLGVWPDAKIKFAYFDKQLSASAEPASSLLTGLAILRSIMRKQPRILLRNLKQLQTLLRPSFENHTDNAQMLASLCSFLREAIAALTATAEQEGQEVMNELLLFMRWLGDTIGQGLLVQPEQKVHGSLQLLQALVSQRPEMLAQPSRRSPSSCSASPRTTRSGASSRRRRPRRRRRRRRDGGGGGAAGAQAHHPADGAERARDGRAAQDLLSALLMLIERSTAPTCSSSLSRWSPTGSSRRSAPARALPKERANLLLKMVQLDQVPSAA